MTNNDIMKKLRVALKLRDTEIVQILRLAEFDISESELGAIFRNEDHPKYKPCGDQLLRNFLNGLIIHLRGPMPERPDVKKEEKKEHIPREKPALRAPSSSGGAVDKRPRRRN
jgi:hypothetical protein